MWIDQNRIRSILKTEHSYYGEVTKRVDGRWYPGVVNFIKGQLTPAMHVLDAGCGNGETLLALSPDFHTGVGIDNDPEHLQLAEETKCARGIQNVEFLLLDFPRESARLRAESFDLVFTMRGPIMDDDSSIQAALRLIRPGGLLFCEAIGEQHQKEVNELFFPSSSGQLLPRRAAEDIAALERNGVDVRLSADLFTKWIYPDVYAWVQYISNLWTWLGIPLLEPDDPRIAQFAERSINSAGEIETTHHVTWVGGVKKGA